MMPMHTKSKLCCACTSGWLAVSTRRRALILACGCVSLLLAPRLVAETLINETFDTGLDGWTVATQPDANAGTIAWSSRDSAGLGSSGSLAITANGAAEVAAERCLPVSEPIQNFSVSAKIMFPHVLEPGGNAFLFCRPSRTARAPTQLHPHHLAHPPRLAPAHDHHHQVHRLGHQVGPGRRAKPYGNPCRESWSYAEISRPRIQAGRVACGRKARC